MTKLTDDPTRVLLADLIRWLPDTSPPRWQPADEFYNSDGNPEGANQMHLDGSGRWRKWNELKNNYSYGDEAYYWYDAR